jgi:hypothetical protein
MPRDKRTIDIQVRAIMARFNNKLTPALHYVCDMMQHATLRAEYSIYFEELMAMRGSSL